MNTLSNRLSSIFMATIVAAISGHFSSCNGDNTEPDVPTVTLTASPEQLDFSADESSQTISVSASSKPSVVSSDSWCTAKVGTFASNSCEVSVAVSENTSTDARTATVSIVCDAQKVKVTINQVGKEAETDPVDDTNFLDEITPGTSIAWTMAKKLGLGWNLGNQLDSHNNGVASETAWGNEKATQATFNGLKAKGITSVRIPVTWMGQIGDAPDYKIDESYLNRVAEVVGYAESAGLNTIINVHHDGADSKYWLNIKQAAASDSDYETITTKYKAVWKQIAEKFKDKGDWLIFEAFNELHDGSWGWGDNLTDGGKQYEVVNKWNQAFVDVVRSTGGNNATRYLGIPGYCADVTLTINNLVLPSDSAKDKLMVAVHCYDPYDYTLGDKYQQWGHTATTNAYPSDNAEKEIVSTFAKLKAKYIDNGIPVYIGESGCANRSSYKATEFQKYYLEFFYKAAKNYGMPAFIWDNGSLSTGSESSGFISHSTGEYIMNGKTIIEAMYKATFTETSSYTLKYVYNHAPTAE